MVHTLSSNCQAKSLVGNNLTAYNAGTTEHLHFNCIFKHSILDYLFLNHYKNYLTKLLQTVAQISIYYQLKT